MARHQWVTRGFADFRSGTFGNGGHNLYVSRAGVLQRIHQFDLNADGYVDLIFCNSQDHWERPPVYIYTSPLEASVPLQLSAEGAQAGAVADLNGDGFDDLVVGNHNNGMSATGMNSTIYYGSPDGWSDRRHQHLPTPWCVAVAAGDFNGDGRPDLAFACDLHKAGKERDGLRIFYQSELAFEPKRFVDLEIFAVQIDAEDVDGDGYCDLLARQADGTVVVYWGGPEGIDPDNHTLVSAGSVGSDGAARQEHEGVSQAEYVPEAWPLVRAVFLPEPHIFVAQPQAAFLLPFRARSLGAPIRLNCAGAQAAAAGDLDGDGALGIS